MQKEQLESALVNAGMKPAFRATVAGEEVFIADGFIKPPHDHLARFGVNKDEFPMGVFMTLWWSPYQKGIGGSLFCEPFHDMNMEVSFRNRARINSAVQAAGAAITTLKRKLA